MNNNSKQLHYNTRFCLRYYWNQLLTGRGRNSAGDARKGAPGKRGGGQRHSEVEIAGALLCAGSILRPSPALSPPCSGALPALRLRSPPRCTGVLARAVLALSAALHWRSPPRYATARLCTATALYIGLRRRSLQAPVLFPSLRSAPPFFAGALPYALPAIGHANAARARSSPLAFNNYLRRGCSLGSLVAGRATVPAAALELLFGIVEPRERCGVMCGAEVFVFFGFVLFSVARLETACN